MNFAFVTKPKGTFELDLEMLTQLVRAAFEMITKGITKAGLTTDMMAVAITRSEKRVRATGSNAQGYYFEFLAEDGIGLDKCVGTFVFFEEELPSDWEMQTFFAEML